MNHQNENTERFFIRTLGCKVNQYESQVIREALSRNGFRECLSKEMADIYIVNTCTVTEHADKDSRSAISSLHKTNPEARIVVTGCYVEKDFDDISFLPGVAHIVKNRDKNRIAGMLANTDTQYAVRNTQYEKITDFKGRAKAFVKIQDGCVNRCAYCKVGLVRGELKSKPVSLIKEEVSALAEKGFREIVLTGICLGSWGREIFEGMPSCGGIGTAGLADVLKALDGIEGDFRIRLSSIEPVYVTDELIEYMSGNGRICPHLHIPLQSGDDEVLRRMNRPYSSGYYRKLVEKARRRIKDVAITTDVMIGFPGEGEDNFNNTVNFLKEVLPGRTHIFTFSRRKGTAAYEMTGGSDRVTLKKRYHKLNAAALAASYLYRSAFLGRELPVLVESHRERQSGLLTGYTCNYIKVVFEGPDKLMRSVIPVKIAEASLVRTMGVYER